MSNTISIVATFTRPGGTSEQTRAEVYDRFMMMTQLNNATTRREMYLRAGVAVETRVVITGWLEVPVTIDVPATAKQTAESWNGHGEGGRG